MKRRFILANAQVVANAIAAIRSAPLGYRVTIEEPPRTGEQNDGLWPRIREIAKALPFAGKMRPEEDWKTLLLSGWRAATGRSVEVVEGLEGEPVALGLSSRALSKSDMSDALSYIEAWAAEHVKEDEMAQ